MGEDIEKMTLSFAEGDGDASVDASATDGALALASADNAAALASAWGLTIPPEFIPATKAQVAYWRELCGAISLTGKEGIRDGAWPSELAPSKATLQAMAERGLIVRRGRAWRLKRKTYAWLQYLRLTAVATPPLTVAERPAPHLPTFAEIKQYEAVCRWLDGEPRCRARLPMGYVPEVGVVTPALLQAMRKQKLVRHTSDCSWALSSKWRELLLALWRGWTKAEAEQAPRASSDPPPTAVAAGLDTLYLNRIDPAGLPADLCVQLEDLQELARGNDEEVDTPWRYDGIPLRMYRSGANTTQGGGVSWSYILRNTSLTLLIRKTPLRGIVAQARLGSECLWRLTALRALDELDALVRRMWRGSRRHPHKQQGGETARWQVSQAHLCVDVANAPLCEEQLGRYVSRSRQQAVYAAAQADLRKLYAVVDGRTNGRAGAQSADDLLDPVNISFDLADDLADELADELGWEDPFAFVDEDDLFTDDALAPQRLVIEPEPVEERALQLHRWGKRISGVSWSVGGDIAFVQYDKTLESRLRHKRFMEPLWRANGWDGQASVTRFEARWRRAAFRAFAAPGETQEDLDNPWVFVRRLSDYWRYTVGSAPASSPPAHSEADERLAQGMSGDAVCDAPASEVDVAWIRRVTPVEGDTNRSRWPTDPTWQVVQAATFANADPSARRLMRREQRLCSVEHLDAGAYGYLVSRTAYLHPEGENWDVSWAARKLVESLSKIAAAPDKDFGRLVRERRRQRGLPVLAVPSILPDAPRPPLRQDEAALAEVTRAAETVLQDKLATDDLRAARARLAERRLQETLVALEDAEQRGASRREQSALEERYLRALEAYATNAANAANAANATNAANAARADSPPSH